MKYDRYENHTVVSTGPVALATPLDQEGPVIDIGIELTAMYSCPGSELCKPATVGLLFMARSTSGWRFLRLHRLVVLADTVRIDFGELKHDGDVGAGYVLEFMSISIPLETFRLMISAERMIGKLGTTEFELTRPEPFRALFEKMP